MNRQFSPGASFLQSTLDFAEEQPAKFQSIITHSLSIRASTYETNVALGKTANWKYVVLSNFPAFHRKDINKEPKEVSATVLDKEKQ